jgi:uncharacterized membrane protein
MAAAADEGADVHLQISLLAEHEITRLVTLVSGIADRMGVKTEADADLEEITRDVAPEAVLDQFEAAEPGAERQGSVSPKNLCLKNRAMGRHAPCAMGVVLMS